MRMPSTSSPNEVRARDKAWGSPSGRPSVLPERSTYFLIQLSETSMRSFESRLRSAGTERAFFCKMQIENRKLKIEGKEAMTLHHGAAPSRVHQGKFGDSPNSQISICNFQFAKFFIPVIDASKLLKEPVVIPRQMADIRNPVFQHGDAVDAEAEGEAGVF